MKAIALIISLIMVMIISTEAFAHSGRTDSNGCHHDRKTGTRHCH